MGGLSTSRANIRNGTAENVPDEKGEIIMENSNHYPLNLQFFGDPAPAAPATTPPTAAAPETTPAVSPATTPATPAAEPPKAPTFAEMLKAPGFASDLDKHVAKAITTAKTKWDEDAKLTEGELAKKKQTEAENALKDREAALAARELKADMVTEIGKRGLPAALIDAVSLADKDTAEASLADVEKAYRAAVQAGIDEKLKGNPPPAGGSGNPNTGTDVGAEIKSTMFGKK
jgi:hypothetical protein